MENPNASQATIDSLFVAEGQIPEQYKLTEIHQREYLLNGKLVPDASSWAALKPPLDTALK